MSGTRRKRGSPQAGLTRCGGQVDHAGELAALGAADVQQLLGALEFGGMKRAKLNRRAPTAA